MLRLERACWYPSCVHHLRDRADAIEENRGLGGVELGAIPALVSAAETSPGVVISALGALSAASSSLCSTTTTSSRSFRLLSSSTDLRVATEIFCCRNSLTSSGWLPMTATRP